LYSKRSLLSAAFHPLRSVTSTMEIASVLISLEISPGVQGTVRRPTAEFLHFEVVDSTALIPNPPATGEAPEYPLSVAGADRGLPFRLSGVTLKAL
jgi:hypothetical protein